MLGKAIKNEFRNREHTVLVVLLMLLAGAIFLRTLNGFKEQVGTVVLIFALLINIVYWAVNIAAFVVAFITPVKDFRDRFFKDQGYLTHTLPLNIPTLIGARLIVDLAIMAQLILVTFFCNWFAYRDDDFLDDIIAIMEMFKYSANKGEIIHYFILSVILLSVAYLSFIWLFCASYTIGHSLFNKYKRIITTVTAVILSTIAFVFFLKTWVSYMTGDLNIDTPDSLMWLFIIAAGVSLIIHVLIVGIIFKKKLNLE